MLHPCNTSEIMRLLLDGVEDGAAASLRAHAAAGGSAEEEDEPSLPDIDNVDAMQIHESKPSSGLPPAAPAVPALPGARFGDNDASDKDLLRYLLIWIRLVAPVMGLAMEK